MMLSNIQGKQVLDAGCGEGNIGRLLANQDAEITAVDLDLDMFKIAHYRTVISTEIILIFNAIFECMSELPSNRFDFVVTNLHFNTKIVLNLH